MTRALSKGKKKRNKNNKVVKPPVCKNCPVLWPEPYSGLCGYCRGRAGYPTVDSPVHRETQRNLKPLGEMTSEEIAETKQVHGFIAR